EVGAGIAFAIDGDRLPLRPGLVDREETEGVLLSGDLEEGYAPAGAVLELGEDAFDQRVPVGEEVAGFVLDRLLAVEGAQVARARRHARKVIDQGFWAK